MEERRTKRIKSLWVINVYYVDVRFFGHIAFGFSFYYK